MPPISKKFNGPSPFFNRLLSRRVFEQCAKGRDDQRICTQVMLPTNRHTDRQTHRQTDTQDYKVSKQKQTLPHICVGRE